MTLQDPFSDAPAEEAQSAPEPAAPVAVADRPVAVPSEGKVVVTLKGGSGYDAPWIVIHASSVDDAYSQFDGKLAELMTKVQAAGAHFSGQAPAKPAGAAPAANGRPAGATEAPSWAPPKPYDDFVYKTGVSAKTGKTWHAWMPPQKGDNREAKFFYPN